MTTVIYADVLVAMNILFTYVLLTSSRAIVKVCTKKWAFLIGSVFGGFSSLIIFFDIGTMLSLFIKLIIGAVIVAVSFLPKTPKAFLKEFFAFFTVSFLFGGVMYFAFITLAPGNMLFKNGTVYFDVSIVTLIAALLCCYGLLLLGENILKRRASDNTLYEATLFFRARGVTFKAFYDTGNTLSDGIEGKPVVIAELKAILPLLYGDEIKYLKSGDVTAVTPQTLKPYFRIVPCNSIGGSGIMMGFVPDRIIIKSKSNSCETDFLIVGVYNGELSAGEYEALLNSEIFERSKKSNDKAVEV